MSCSWWSNLAEILTQAIFVPSYQQNALVPLSFKNGSHRNIITGFATIQGAHTKRTPHMLYNLTKKPVTVSLASAGVKQQQVKIVVPEQQVQASEHSYDSSSGFEFDHSHIDAGKGNNGAELSSLAHSSAIQAKNAVQNQHTAGSQAAFGVKSSLASAAVGAAQTAQAALVGKQAIVQNLKRQAIEVQSQVQAEIAQYHQLEQVSASAQESSQQTQALAQTLGAALAAAQSGAQRSEHAAAEAAQAAAAQHSMVEHAKQNLAQILAQLQSAVADLHETESSALRAAEAAQIAQSNAAAAGLAVAAASAKGQAQTGEYEHHYHH